MSWRERISSACVRNDDLGMDLKKAKADYDEYLKVSLAYHQQHLVFQVN